MQEEVIDMLRINPNLKPPQNETELHFLLKNIAVSYLKSHFGCQFANKEIDIGAFYNKKFRHEFPDFPWGKRIADAVGIQRKFDNKINDYELIVRCIEVKISKADLNNGYCTSGDYNYIMAPKGLFTMDDLLPFVGLIEVDLENLRWDDGFAPIRGVEVTINSQKANYGRKNRDFWLEIIKDKMLKAYTNEHAFKGLWFYPGFVYKKK